MRHSMTRQVPVPERRRIRATLERFNAALLSEPSATLTLDAWCREHGVAVPGGVSVDMEERGTRPLPDGAGGLLRLTGGDTLLYRRVRLHGGGRVLSRAENWFTPQRLTPEMNARLSATTEAFGRVVAPLRFTRETVESRWLWSWPFIEDGMPTEKGDLSPGAIPDDILQHVAVLSREDGMPISLVIETYNGDLPGLQA